MSIVTATVTETVTYHVQWVKLSRAVEKRVTNKLKEDLKHWKNDIGMKSMFVQDAADGLAVCEALEEGKWRDVEQRLWDMDTAARESVYEMIETELGMSWNEFTAGLPQ